MIKLICIVIGIWCSISQPKLELDKYVIYPIGDIYHMARTDCKPGQQFGLAQDEIGILPCVKVEPGTLSWAWHYKKVIQ